MLPKREVDVNAAGFLELATYNMLAPIGVIDCFYENFSSFASQKPVLNFPPNPASTQKVPMALYDCFRATRPLTAIGLECEFRLLPTDLPFVM